MQRRFVESTVVGSVLMIVVSGCTTAVDGSALSPSVAVNGTTTTADPTNATTPEKTGAPTVRSATSPAHEPAAPAFPAQLVGTWESLDSGNATDVIRFEQPGRFKRASVLTQQRTSGLFKYTISATGNVRLSGQNLALEPTSGTQKLEDPDAVNGGWERPHTLEVERFQWSVTGGQLRLSGETGTVAYKRI
jgi:hypothetical protein